MTKKKYKFKCPKCLKEFKEIHGIRLTPSTVKQLAAVSRRDGKTHICLECGKAEACFDYYLRNKEDDEKISPPWDPLVPIPVAEVRRIERSWLSVSNTP